MVIFIAFLLLLALFFHLRLAPLFLSFATEEAESNIERMIR